MLKSDENLESTLKTSCDCKIDLITRLKSIVSNMKWVKREILTRYSRIDKKYFIEHVYSKIK